MEEVHPDKGKQKGGWCCQGRWMGGFNKIWSRREAIRADSSGGSSQKCLWRIVILHVEADHQLIPAYSNQMKTLISMALMVALINMEKLIMKFEMWVVFSFSNPGKIISFV